MGRPGLGRASICVARRPRELVEGGIYHVFARGNDRQAIFRNDLDRHLYLRGLRGVVETSRWSCLAYCLMSNHVHLLVETPQANLDRGMQRLHSAYAQGFNWRHGRVGHLFQGRYGAVRIATDGQLCLVAAYIARNPVVTGYCRHPEDWRWSSFRSIFGPSATPWIDSARMLNFFDANRAKALRRYREMSQTRDPSF